MSTTLRSRISGAIRWQFDRLFDHRFGVDTSGITPLAALDIEGENVAAGVFYEPTPTRYFSAAMQALPIEHREFSFVDFGSGKGRVLLLASRLPFEQVIGVEFSPELHETAQRNIERFGKSGQARCARVSSVCADAVDFALPAGPLVLYFFNPFKKQVFERVLDNIQRSVEASGCRLVIVYCEALCDALISARPFARYTTTLELPPILSRSRGWISSLKVYANFQMTPDPVKPHAA